MACFVSVKNREGEYKTYPVPNEVYNYIRQLEFYIQYPKSSRLLDVYKERFKKRKCVPILLNRITNEE